MKTVHLGKTEILISPIGLGCWQFSGGKGISGKYWAKVSDEQARDIVKATLDGGINWFDTAEVYGWGESERTLARALKDLKVKPGSVVIASKWFPLLRTAASITSTFKNRTEAFGEYPIDLYQIHMPTSISSIAKQMDKMADLLAERKIKAIGVSNFSALQMRLAHESLGKRGMVLAANQVRYNLLNREIEKNGVLQTARELGITIIAYSPLAQGILTGKFHERRAEKNKPTGFRKFMQQFKTKSLEKTRPLIELLQEIAVKKKCAPAQVALAWIITSHGGSVVAIPGASKVSQAQSNALAMQITLTPDEIGRLDQTSAEIISLLS